MGVGESTASTLAMVIHELATNSVKHGALSSETGTLNLSGRSDDDRVHLIWSETGGPKILQEPEMSGFGSRMILRSVAAQLGGSLTYDWQTSGLVATLIMQKVRMER
jgi:two-component sensor histidine kinase